MRVASRAGGGAPGPWGGQAPDSQEVTQNAIAVPDLKPAVCKNCYNLLIAIARRASMGPVEPRAIDLLGQSGCASFGPCLVCLEPTEVPLRPILVQPRNPPLAVPPISWLWRLPLAGKGFVEVCALWFACLELLLAAVSGDISEVSQNHADACRVQAEDFLAKLGQRDGGKRLVRSLCGIQFHCFWFLSVYQRGSNRRAVCPKGGRCPGRILAQS